MKKDVLMPNDELRNPAEELAEKSGAEHAVATCAAVPGYLDSDSADSNGVIDHDGKQLGATVLLPAMTLDLPMNHRGEPIDIEVDDPIFGWGTPTPYRSSHSAAANESRKVTVKVSIRVHSWEFGWPEEMQPESAIASVSSAENQVIAEGAE